MTKEEFEAGIPFKMSPTDEVQPVYSFVNVGGLLCIQSYTVANPNPMYHCKVLDIFNYGVKVRNELLGFDHHVVALFEKMFRVGDGIPVYTIVRDLLQANVYEDRENFKVVIWDLYNSSACPWLTKLWPTLEGAKKYARETIKHE